MNKVNIYSVIINIKNQVENNKEVENIITNSCFRGYKNRNKFVDKHIERIFQELVNNRYTLNDLILFIYHWYIYNDKIDYNEINDRNIHKILQIYTKEQLDKDKKTLIEINDKLDLNGGIEKYFSLDYSHKSIIFKLIQEKTISPIFWIKYDYVFGVVNRNKIELDNHKKFRKIMGLLKNHLIERGYYYGKKV